MVDPSVLSGYAHPCPVLMHPRIREAAPALVWLALVHALYAVDSGHDRGVAVDVCLH
jgi:hypothetical protein